MKIKRISKIKNEKEIRIQEIMSDRPREVIDGDDPNVYIGTYQSLEKWPEEFFHQFHTVACDEAHGAKAKTVTTILKRTFKHAHCRFGVSGTFPDDDSCEILNIQSVLGPKITEVSADQLKKKGIITPMEIKAVIMNHGDKNFANRLNDIRKAGMGKEAHLLEKDYIHVSSKRLDMITKIVKKCDNNTLVLFHSIEYGSKIFNLLKESLPDKEFFYIDGMVKNKQREEIKKQMEINKTKVEYTILNFGSYEVDVKSDTMILLSNGEKKIAKDITSNDDIDDEFIKTLRNDINRGLELI